GRERKVVLCVSGLFVITPDDDSIFVIPHCNRKDAAAGCAFDDWCIRHRPRPAAVYRLKDACVAAAAYYKCVVAPLGDQAGAACSKSGLTVFCRRHLIRCHMVPFYAACRCRYEDIMAVHRIAHCDAVHPVPASDRVIKCLLVLVLKLQLPCRSAVCGLVYPRALTVTDR